MQNKTVICWWYYDKKILFNVCTMKVFNLNQILKNAILLGLRQSAWQVTQTLIFGYLSDHIRCASNVLLVKALEGTRIIID